MNKVKPFLKSKACLFLFGFVVIFLLQLITNETSYPWDSGGYMGLGLLFGLDDFSLANYNEALRGYLLPLCHWALYKLEALGIGNITLNLYLFHSVLFSASLMIIIPNLMEKLFKFKLTTFVRCAFFVVCIIMFKGHLIYPITDLPAFSCMCAALYLMMLIRDGDITKLPVKITASFGIGLLLGAAYYMRPIYLISIILFFIYAVIKLVHYIYIYIYIYAKNTDRRIKVFDIPIFMIVIPALGLLTIAAPQIYINYDNYNVIDPRVMTEKVYEGSLYLQQLIWGLGTQRYETNLDMESFASARVVFYDGIGSAILANSEIHSYWDYIVFVFTHFFDVLFIYLRHIFNGMDIAYPNGYIKNMYNSRIVVQFVNYTLLFLGIAGLKRNIKKSTWTYDFIGSLLIYIMPVILCIPASIETRFFMGAQVVMFIMACKTVTDIDWKQEVLQNKKVLLKYGIFLIVCFMFNSYAFGTIGIPFNK